MDVSLFQNFLIEYIECGLYKKFGRAIVVEKIKEDIKKLDNQNFQSVLKERKELENVMPKTPKKMPCGASELEENHYPILLCEFCEHKFNEANIPGFC